MPPQTEVERGQCTQPHRRAGRRFSEPPPPRVVRWRRQRGHTDIRRKRRQSRRRCAAPAARLSAAAADAAAVGLAAAFLYGVVSVKGKSCVDIVDQGAAAHMLFDNRCAAAALPRVLFLIDAPAQADAAAAAARAPN